MTRLRIALPPLDSLSAGSRVDFAWLDRQGQVSREGQDTLAHLGQTGTTAAVECFLHPQDSPLTSLELPSLPAARITAAVACAAQALMLGNPEQMHVAHSPREADGQVYLSWLPRTMLERLALVLSEAQLKLRGLYPAAYALPVPADARLAVCTLDGHLLVRHSLQQAAVHPLADDALHDLLASGVGLLWVGESAAQSGSDSVSASLPDRLPASQRWVGAAPGWGLQGGMGHGAGARQGWGRAVACCAMALAVWTLGLNLYAAREAAQGQQLKAQMNQRVKQAFPELPVILNPLQQARQQLAARQSGAAADPAQRFSSLVQQAGSAMPFMAGSVQSLTFENGELQLGLLADTRKSSADSGWQATLAQAGFEASANDTGWRLRPVSDAPQQSAEQSPGGEDDE